MPRVKAAAGTSAQRVAATQIGGAKVGEEDGQQ